MNEIKKLLVRTHRDEQMKEVKQVAIQLGTNSYRIIATIDDRLEIIKVSDDNSHEICVFSRASNSIEIK